MSVTTLMTSVKLAARLNLQPRTVDKWRVLGMGPAFIRINGRVYYEEDAVQEWLDASRHQSTAEYDAPNGARGFKPAHATA